MFQSAVLLVESHQMTQELLRQSLEDAGARVHAFAAAATAYDFLQDHPADLVLTDWISGPLDGLELCKLIKRSKQHAHIPVVIMAERASEIDAVTALEVGAEDYVRKPLLVRELLARLKKILQRNHRGLAPPSEKIPPAPPPFGYAVSDEVIEVKEIRLDTTSHQAFLDNSELTLTYSEFRLLELFLANPGRVFQRNAIIEKINGIDYYATERSVDVLVVGLRKKLGPYKKYLETVRGVGYRFSERSSNF